jgi:hypothetical protein
MSSIWSTGLRPRAGPDARGYSHLRARTAAEGLKSARQSPSSVNIAPAPESFSLISADRRRFARVCAGASPLWDDPVECPSLHRAFSSPMVARISERSMVPTITLISLALLEMIGWIRSPPRLMTLPRHAHPPQRTTDPASLTIIAAILLCDSSSSSAADMNGRRSPVHRICTRFSGTLLA